MYESHQVKPDGDLKILDDLTPSYWHYFQNLQFESVIRYIDAFKPLISQYT